LLVEAALRGGALALLALLATMSLPAVRGSAAARYGVLFALSVAAYVIGSAPDPALQRAPWIIPLRLFSIGTPAIFWLWACAHFDDDFVPDRRRWLAWAGLVALGAAAMSTDRAVLWNAAQAAALLLAGLGLWQALSGRQQDLVESRRCLRAYLAIGAALYIAATNLCFLLPWLHIRWNGGLVDAVGLAAMAFGFAVSRVLSAPDNPAPAATAVAPKSPVLGWNRPAVSRSDDPEATALASLQTAMEYHKAYREDGFSITMLAARLNIPEYRLRRLINQRLGQRNFTAFVNSYRLAEVMAALSDPSQADVPILTIALDAGFQSLGPFNRAFKAETGMTPSEFRRRSARASRPAAE
jgi:AraC-like DNA-binding protein